MPKRSVSHKEGLFEDLQDPVFAANYFSAALEDDDFRVALVALRNIADARGGIAKIAEETGLNRESLYKSLREEGNPKIDTFYKVLHAVGIKLFAAPDNHKAA